MDSVKDPSRSEQTRREVIRRLHRVEGQVRGIAGMVEQDRYCIDILTQVAAATRALHSVALALLDDHRRHCLAATGDVSDSVVDQASAAIAPLLRS